MIQRCIRGLDRATSGGRSFEIHVGIWIPTLMGTLRGEEIHDVPT